MTIINRGSTLPVPASTESRPDGRHASPDPDRHGHAVPRRQTSQSSIWRPSAPRTRPPTPQWPLPQTSLSIRNRNQDQDKEEARRQPGTAHPKHDVPDIAKPLPPTPLSSRRPSASASASASTATLTDVPPPPPSATTHASAKTGSTAETPLLLPSRPPPTTTVPPPPSPSAAAAATSPRRPSFFPERDRGLSFQTRYIEMLLAVDRIPRLHNILSSVFGWLVLVGFVLAPANFTDGAAAAAQSPWSCPSRRNIISSSNTNSVVITITRDDINNNNIPSGICDGSQGPTTAAAGIPSAPLLGLAAALVPVGAAGTAWLAVRWRRNYVWLVNRVYLPLVLHSLAGLLATVALVCVSHGGHWGATAAVAAGLEGALLVVSGGLLVLYGRWLLGRVRSQRGGGFRKGGGVGAGRAPAWAPGSVV